MVAWMEWIADELNGSPTMQVLFFVLVVVGRLALDRWERRRELELHRKRRDARNG